MFAWPALELTAYERRFVNVYGDGKKPGVLRRAYEIEFNSLADPNQPGLEAVRQSGSVQIARRSRVFALQFAGMIGSWQINIRTASGETFTANPTQLGAVASSNWPVVSSLIAGSHMNQFASYKDQQNVNPAADEVRMFGSFQSQPLLIDPNWELKPNEQLIFEGVPISYAQPDPPNAFPDGQKRLSIVAHVWEFPNMDGRGDRMGAGPAMKEEAETAKRKVRKGCYY